MSKCSGPNCHAELGWVTIKGPTHDRVVPVDVGPNGSIRQEVTLADGRRGMAFVLHHSTCPDVELFRNKKRGGASHG